MIHPDRVQLVQQLLGEKKYSQRAIARLAGVSRGSVGAIAAGRRRDFSDRQPPADDDSWKPTGPITRCPNCGGRVYAPCRLCLVRERLTGRLPARPRIPGR